MTRDTSALRAPKARGRRRASPPELARLTQDDRHAALFPPRADLRTSLRALREDLAEVRVLGDGGRVIDVHDKVMAEPALKPAQKHRIFRVLAEVRDAYLRADAAVPATSNDKGYQLVNWKHTRAEIDQVLEAAKLAGLGAAQLEDALLASIFSDAVKVPGNFIVHNVDGAAAAATVLARYFDSTLPRNLARITGIARIIQEHQVSPPGFMAGIAKGLVRKKLEGGGALDEAALESMAAKIARPFAAPLVFDDGAAIELTPGERELLAAIGVHEWRVPHPSTPWYGASRAVIDGDCLINYACPEGWAKIAALRGPDTQPFFEDATVLDSLHSAKQSYDDALSVMSEAAHPLAAAGLARTRRAIERVRDRMRVWLAAQPWLPANPDGTIPFWNAPLAYPRQRTLSPREQEQFRFAKQIRTRVIELLRDEQGSY